MKINFRRRKPVDPLAVLRLHNTDHWERRLYPPQWLRLTNWRFFWQYRSVRQLGFVAGGFPHDTRQLTYNTDVEKGFVFYLWHYVFYARKDFGVVTHFVY